MIVVLQLAGLMLRVVGWERLLWRWLLAGYPSGAPWYEQREYMHSYINFIIAAPYKPNYRHDFGKEQIFIEVSNAALNVFYQCGDMNSLCCD